MYIKFRGKRHSIYDVAFNAFNATVMGILIIFTMYPFLNTLAISFNEGIDAMRGGIRLWPREFTLQNYQAVFVGGTIIRAFFVSVARTVLAAVINVFLTAMLSYCLTRKEYVLNKFITIAFVLTMYFNAGLIPTYHLIQNLGLLNSFWVYIIPAAISAFNVIVVRTFMNTIPESFIESAKLDGAGDFKIFMRIIFPLSKPALAVVGMFTIIFQWNNWFDTYLYAPGNQSLSTLQFELQKLLASSFSQGTAQRASTGLAGEMASSMVTSITIQAAITVIAMVPILSVYPLLQRYFIAGLNVGGVKE
ncbi:carbohydrate ABC transporter permease [Herbivorax sp. ANBcel31]|uniref:carbohydrate ABC transporter permease n=1 Tax=Herbivorax sp. ANBcel31 TaxID=3069754 RepID=UPI0027AFA0B1|nr:carbohydrate ABC transporter permease [Herbivorax sp. ANBcel31]MDQ2084867.1 carbohydrate ABC transporter permease [Herbivorax sp. ANBcel31]